MSGCGTESAESGAGAGDCQDCHGFPAPFAGNSLAVLSVSDGALLNDDAALVQQFARPVFEGLHIAVAGRGETYQGRIDP